MAQLPNGLVLNLADSFPGHAENLTHFFQGVGASVVHTKAHPQYIGFPLGEGAQNFFQGLCQQGVGGGIGGAGGTLVLHEGADGGVFFVTHRGVQAQGIGSGAVCLDDFLNRQPQLLGDFLHSGFTTQLLHQLAVAASGLVDNLHHMHGNPDGSRLVGNGAGDGLPNPPGCVSREFVALGPVELVNGTNQTGVALLNQIQDVQTPSGILLCNGHHQPEVCFGELVLGLLVAFGNPLCQLHFLLGGQQLHLTDFFQVHPHRVIQAVFGSQIHRVNQFFFFQAAQVDVAVHHVQAVVQCAAQHVQAIVQRIQVGGGNLDVHGLKAVVNFFNFVGGEIHLGQDIVQVRVPNHAFLLALCNQRLQGCLHIFQFPIFLCSAHMLPLYLIILSNFVCCKTIPHFRPFGKGFLEFFSDFLPGDRNSLCPFSQKILFTFWENIDIINKIAVVPLFGDAAERVRIHCFPNPPARDTTNCRTH